MYIFCDPNKVKYIHMSVEYCTVLYTSLSLTGLKMVIPYISSLFVTKPFFVIPGLTGIVHQDVKESKTASSDRYSSLDDRLDLLFSSPP
jgi:hypothetical protein